MQMFDWLLCYVLKNSHSKLDKSLKEGKDAFTARNENQVFYSKTLSIVFIEVIKSISNIFYFKSKYQINNFV